MLGLAALLAAPLAAEAPPRPRPAPEGEVCGDPALVGAAVAAIAGGGGCGVAAPVRISAAAGVGLEPPVIVTCATARTLAAWLGGDAVPAFSAKGAGLEALEVVDGYACRNRNRAATGKISEHARGRAIDIGGFRLGDGTVVTVREGWGSEAWGKTLRRLHNSACGPFGTVLGPEANALHADHLHFDTEERRSGPWCE